MAVKTAKPVFFPTLSKDDIRKLRESISYELAWDGMNLLRSKSEPNLAKFMSLVTLAYIYKKIGVVSRERLYDVLRETEMDYSVGLKLNSVLDEFYTEAETLAYKCSEEQLLSLIFGNLSWYFRSMGKRSGSVATPEAFAHIGRELLQVKPGESVMDYCFGFGDFAIGAYLNTKAKAVYGTEISTDAVIVSKIRAAFIDEAISVKQGDSLLDDLSADKIYADPPMAMRETNAYHFSLTGEKAFPSLSDDDKEILDKVIKKLGKMTKDDIISFMHSEEAYAKTKLWDVISFEYAKNLRI